MLESNDWLIEWHSRYFARKAQQQAMVVLQLKAIVLIHSDVWRLYGFEIGILEVNGATSCKPVAPTIF